MSKKILLVIESFNIGGAERQAFNLAATLTSRSYKVTMGAFNYSGPLLEECKKMQISTTALPGNFSAESFKYQQPRAKVIRSMIALWASLFKTGAQVIIPFTAPCNVAINYLIKYLPGTSFWNQRDEGRGLAQDYWVINSALHNCPAFISNSSEGADFIKVLCGKEELPVKIIYNGITQKQAIYTEAEWRVKLGISATAKIGVMLANVHAAKDHETAIKAWKHVTEHFNEKPVLVFAGNYGEQDALYIRLKNLIEELHLDALVRFTGFTPDVHGLLGSSSLCVFSSHREGLPNAILEPMSYGLPVAATDLPGVREALGADYPFITPHQDHEKLAQSVITLLKDPAQYKMMSERNKNRIDSLFSVESMANQYVALLEEHG